MSDFETWYSYSHQGFMILVDGFPGDSDNKESACSTGDPVCSLGWEDPPEKGTSTLSSVLAWRIPWTEEPGGLQSMGLQRVREWLTHVTLVKDTHINRWDTKLRSTAARMRPTHSTKAQEQTNGAKTVSTNPLTPCPHKNKTWT